MFNNILIHCTIIYLTFALPGNTTEWQWHKYCLPKHEKT